MIVQPNEMSFADKNFSMIIYGPPGVGKSTLALSAPDPVLIDFDGGIARVKAYHRKTTIQCQNYEEVLKDLNSDAVRNCKTIIVDTGGSFITYLQDWAMRTNPAVNKTKSGTISIKGFGAVKQEFLHFSNLVRDTMHKNVIYVFHSQEQADKDGNPQQRLLCEGAAKNIVWQPCDFGGYVSMIGDRRTIAFSPTQEYFAKGCFGIDGIRQVPSLTAKAKNDFIARIFEEARANITKENEVFAPQLEEYEYTMSQVRAIVDGINSAETATEAAKTISEFKHIMTSKQEARAILAEKITTMGLRWDSKAKEYKVKQ